MSIKQQAESTVALTNLAVEIMEARGFDCAGIACGLVVLARIIVGDDLVAKTLLAEQMAKLAVELDPHAIDVRWQ
jgi:hypothetical protein